MKLFDVLEAKKSEPPKQRNPIAAYAQRSGAGVHKDQNKKNIPLRKEKHKKKDMAYEEYTVGRSAQVKGKEPMPKKQAGRTDHPFHGRLVGENDLTELDREKKAQTANNIFMRFGLKRPVSTVAGADADPYLVGFAGFANTPADVKFADAKWKFYNLKKKEDFVNAVKKMMADKTFTAAGGVTIYVDNSLFKKFPAYGDFLSMVSRMGGDKIRVEFKPQSDDDSGEKGAGKKRVKAKWADPDAKVDPAEKQTTRYFTVTNPRLMNQLRRSDKVMQYYRPNKNAFVMGQKDFDAFVKAFGRDDIKIVDKFREDTEVNEIAPAVALLAPLVGSAIRIGGPKLLQGIGKMILRNPGKFGVATGAVYTYNSIMDMFPDIDPKILQMLKDYGLPALAVVGMIYAGKKIFNRLKSKETESIAETATAGGTSSGSIAVVPTTQKRKKKTTLIKR